MFFSWSVALFFETLLLIVDIVLIYWMDMNDPNL